jgi:hypothetical protein
MVYTMLDHLSMIIYGDLGDGLFLFYQLYWYEHWENQQC